MILRCYFQDYPSNYIVENCIILDNIPFLDHLTLSYWRFVTPAAFFSSSKLLLMIGMVLQLCVFLLFCSLKVSISVEGNNCFYLYSTDHMKTEQVKTLLHLEIFIRQILPVRICGYVDSVERYLKKELWKLCLLSNTFLENPEW